MHHTRIRSDPRPGPGRPLCLSTCQGVAPLAPYFPGLAWEAGVCPCRPWVRVPLQCRPCAALARRPSIGPCPPACRPVHPANEPNQPTRLDGRRVPRPCLAACKPGLVSAPVDVRVAASPPPLSSPALSHRRSAPVHSPLCVWTETLPSEEAAARWRPTSWGAHATLFTAGKGGRGHGKYMPEGWEWDRRERQGTIDRSRWCEDE